MDADLITKATRALAQANDEWFSGVGDQSLSLHETLARAVIDVTRKHDQEKAPGLAARGLGSDG